MSGTNGYCGFDLQFPGAVDVIKVPDMIEGCASWPYKEVKDVDYDHRTTIGFCFVHLVSDSPMVYGYMPVYLGRCPRLWYERLAAFL